MTRREIRETIFKMVFRVEFHNEEEIPEQLRMFMDSLESASEKDRAYIEHKVQDILAHLDEIDEI
ncbi:MAG: transcription antitermination factor NusB, partial [Lachnospiraceae bacterium]|nr:transcription antitermination factor NusB [bacterium]MDY5518120.1 transcription antitermination factor NusB [Lachnospiraceae bacterium]